MLLPLIRKHEILLKEIVEKHFSSSSNLDDDLERLGRQELENNLNQQIAYLSDMDRVDLTDADSDVNSGAQDRSGREKPAAE